MKRKLKKAVVMLIVLAMLMSGTNLRAFSAEENESTVSSETAEEMTEEETGEDGRHVA